LKLWRKAQSTSFEPERKSLQDKIDELLRKHEYTPDDLQGLLDFALKLETEADSNKPPPNFNTLDLVEGIFTYSC
jgi:hypothetical protein